MNKDRNESVYFEPGYVRRLCTMVQGLRKPSGSREYKEARIELQRLSAPLTAILLPTVMVSLLIALGPGNAEKVKTIDIERWEDIKVIELEKPTPQDPVRKEEREEFVIPDLPQSLEAPATAEQTAEAYSPQPQSFNAVLNIKSPYMFKGVLGVDRDAGARGSALGGGGGQGSRETEDAVMRTLRWLKKTQAQDGSWPRNRIAMTGLAVLTFLAHAETPGESEEFGETVRRGIEFLLSQQKADGRFMGVDGNDYSHPIATYALCEAYGMTYNPNVKAAVERALVPIVNGQHPTGGWTYQMYPGQEKDDAGRESGAYRDDTSYMGWCVQALKAAHLVQANVPGLADACKKAVRGFKANAAPNGGFGYTSPGTGGLTSVGTLCLQLLGASDDRATKLSSDLMAQWKPSFADKAPGIGDSLQYYYYYATQSKYHFGGPRWESWNKEMKSVYVGAQKIEKNAIKDAEGRDRDIGWWENGDTHTDRPVMDTCLAALQLMVYYRGGLRTTSEIAIPAELRSATLDGDIEIGVEI
ncbi:MAG: terpene cyclase/mutase family protein [Kiritimatiellaeota bacterium]|nr:terpene cyclase/mutase family protein [Kiritimatiellota bacterium]